MLNKNVEVFMGCDTGWHFASTVLFGAPFDSTTMCMSRGQLRQQDIKYWHCHAAVKER